MGARSLLAHHIAQTGEEVAICIRSVTPRRHQGARIAVEGVIECLICFVQGRGVGHGDMVESQPNLS